MSICRIPQVLRSRAPAIVPAATSPSRFLLAGFNVTAEGPERTARPHRKVIDMLQQVPCTIEALGFLGLAARHLSTSNLYDMRQSAPDFPETPAGARFEVIFCVRGVTTAPCGVPLPSE